MSSKNPMSSQEENNGQEIVKSDDRKSIALFQTPKDVEKKYCEYEAEDFLKPDPSKNFHGGFFYQDYSTFIKPKGIFDMIWKICFRLELIWFFSNRTVWDYTIQPLFLWISRKVSGLSSDESSVVHNVDDFEYKKGFYASGYFGWGKNIMLKDPGEITDAFKDELVNITIIAALFLTITIPMLTGTPDSFSQIYIDDIGADLYALIIGVAVVGQLATTVVALSILTNINKVVGDDAGVLFIKSLFNPRNGITGILGPALYVGAIFSWMSTLAAVWIIVFVTYKVWVTILISFAGFCMVIAYWISVYSGIKTENKCSIPAMQEFCDSGHTAEQHKKLQEIDKLTYYVVDKKEAIEECKKS